MSFEDGLFIKYLSFRHLNLAHPQLCSNILRIEA